ncbi:MAG: DUF1028 domain-containing protein [Spirochaetales bacterium]|nr:DUF1028 domain-containing protein [Spirochaetales bacterium]
MEKGRELVHTYSIIAIDRKEGVMGGAVQSHYFSVGGTVIRAKTDTGVVATQAMVNMDYGPEGLRLLSEGLNAHKVLERLIEADPGESMRQAAVLDCRGGIAAHTGCNTIAEAGHRIGRESSCQANMMLKNTVWEAMAAAFERAEGPLAERMLTALQAAENEGGDIRGMQSAAIKIVSLEDKGNVRENEIMDLRVEDSPEPLIELARLIKVHKAYTHADRGDLAVENGDYAGAMEAYKIAEETLPDNLELKFWKAVSLLNDRKFDQVKYLLQDIFQADENWRLLLKRLPAAGIIKNEKEIIGFIESL